MLYRHYKGPWKKFSRGLNHYPPVSALMLVLAPIIVGCSAFGIHERAPNQAGADFYLDAQYCRALAEYKPKVRMNMAGIADLKMDAGFDENRYGTCMVELGWTPKIIDETKEAVADCRARSPRQGAETQAGANTDLMPSADQDAFAKCMRDRGFEGEVLVKPLQPAQPPDK